MGKPFLPVLMLLAAAVAAADEVPELPPELAGDALPQVLTPARLSQAQIDVAASVTVIDREMIAALGPRDIPELLRLVPGMMVAQVNASEFAVNYHGTKIRDVRRLQVLVDGMSVYQPGLARILWSDLALSIDDIERIEVTRGPDAAAYGANAFSGIINIITTHPQDATDNRLKAAAGNRDTLDSYGRLAGHGDDGDWRLSFSTRRDTGYDTYEATGQPYPDSRRQAVANWRSEYRPGARDRLELLAGLSQGRHQEKADDFGVLTRFEQSPLVRIENGHLLGRWTRDVSPSHMFHLQVYGQETDVRHRWRACLDPLLLSSELAAMYAADPDATSTLVALATTNPAAVPGFIFSLPPDLQGLAIALVGTYNGFAMLGYTETCGDFNLDVRETRVDVELQDTLAIGEAVRLVSGASFRRDRASTESYLHDVKVRHNDVWRLFGHGEFRLAPRLLLNLGATVESDDISGSNVSPRAGLNVKLSDTKAVRLVSSRAVRTQDMYEEYASLGITVRNLDPAWPVTGETTRDFFATQRSPGTLVPEEITAWEVGWYGWFPEQRVEADVRLFREKLNHLVSKPANLFEFIVDNDSRTDLTGYEWQLRYSLAPGSFVWASYAYIDNESTEFVETRFTARQSGSVAVAHRFSPAWSGAVAWYQTEHQNRVGSRWLGYERLDMRVAHQLPLATRATLQTSLNLQLHFEDEPGIVGEAYDDRLYGYLAAQLSF